MSNLFKKVTSTVSVVAVIASAVSSSLVAAAGSTFAPYADALATAGIIGKQTTEAGYNLGNNVTRAEMAKVAVNLKKAEVKECTGKVFSDVTSEKLGDLCGYVEAAANAGLVNKAAATAKFRPTDLVTRAEALKMLLSAKGIAASTEDQGFKDLGTDASLNGYINAAAKAGIVNKGTSFNPNGTATRGEAFKIAANAAGLTTTASAEAGDDLNLGDLFGDNTATGATVPTGTTSTGTVTTVTGGDLVVALNPATPAPTSVPAVASAVPYMTVDLSAGSNDTTVSSIVLKRVGFGTRDDLKRVWFEANGIRVSERASFLSDDTATVTFSPAIVVKAGSTMTLKVIAEQNSGTNVINRVSIVSAASIVSNGAIKGTFPVTGNNMTSASYTVASLGVTYQGSTSDYKVGDKNLEFARVQILNRSSDKDVQVGSVKFRNSQDGDITEDLGNIALYEGGSKISSGAVISGRDITFQLSNYVMKAGVSKTFVIQADAINARNTSGDKFKFEIRYQEDLNAVEQATGFGSPNDVTSATSNYTYTVKGSTITVTKSSTSPSTQTVSAGTNDVTLLVADATINQAFRADGLNIRLVTTGFGTGDLLSDSFGNIRVYIGDRIYNSFDFASSDKGSSDKGSQTYTKNFDSSWTFEQGKTTIKVVANVKSGAKTGATIAAKLADGLNVLFKTPRYTQNDNTVGTADISVSADGLASTVGDDNVRVVRNDGYTVANTNVVAGANTVSVYKATMNAGNVSDVKVTKLAFDVSSVAGSLNLLTNWRVKIDGAYNGSARSISSGKVEFTDVNFTVAKNKTAQIEVVADIGTGFGSSNVYTSFSNSSSTLQNVTSGQTIASGKIVASNEGSSVNQGVNVVAGGSLTVARDGNTPSSSIVVAGTQGVEVARFKFSTKYDEMYLKDLYVINTKGSTADARISALKLYDSANSSVVVATASMESGVAHFTLGDTTLKLAKDDSKVLIVKADFNTINNANETGNLIKFAIDESKDDIPLSGVVAGTINGVNVSSVSTGNPLTAINGQNAAAAGLTAATLTNEHQLRKTALRVVSSNLSNTTFAASTDKEIYRFKVSADAAGDAYLKKLTLAVTLTNATATNFKLYKTADQSNAIATVAALAAGKAVLVLAGEETIAKGSEVEFVVKADLTSGATGGAKASVSSNLVETASSFAAAAAYSTGIGDFIFSDNASSQATRDGTSADYFSGFKTASFPTDAKSLTE